MRRHFFPERPLIFRRCELTDPLFEEVPAPTWDRTIAARKRFVKFQPLALRGQTAGPDWRMGQVQELSRRPNLGRLRERQEWSLGLCRKHGDFADRVGR